jgi:magnesium-transporting ATPase (P-type)
MVSGIYTGVIAYAFFFWTLAQGWGEFEARNMLLFLMVLFENVHVFNCRSETRSVFRIPLSNNWPLIAAVIGAQGGILERLSSRAFAMCCRSNRSHLGCGCCWFRSPLPCSL